MIAGLTVPDMATASELYAICLNLARWHPGDEEMQRDCDLAWLVLQRAWKQHKAAL